jgi:UDP-glucose 4-epimerase
MSPTVQRAKVRERHLTGTVLVTGGAGFIGAYVVRLLLAEGIRVLVYDAQPRGNVLDMLLPAHPEIPNLIVESGEITDGWRLLELCRTNKVDTAIHLASPLTMDVVNNPMTGIRDICLGTQTLFYVAREVGMRRVVWASSVAIFGPAADYPPGPLPDDAAHRPPNIYGSCKSLCETLARRAVEIDDVDIVGLRLSVVYGAGRVRGYMSYPSHLMREAAQAGHVHIKFGPQRLHWQYVDEVAAMAVAALTSPISGEGRTFNASGECRSWIDAADALKHARPNLIVTIGNEVDAALDGVVEDYDATGFVNRYNYRSHWPLQAGVRATLDTYDAMRCADTATVFS